MLFVVLYDFLVLWAVHVDFTGIFLYNFRRNAGITRHDETISTRSCR
jgi:hypothetical protein